MEHTNPSEMLNNNVVGAEAEIEQPVSQTGEALLKTVNLKMSQIMFFSY